MIAAEKGELAGVRFAAVEGDCVLTLRSWRWTIDVIDELGHPVAGVPVGCSRARIGNGVRFEGLTLGLTDARGRLVVRCPGAVDIESQTLLAIDPRKTSPHEFVWFEVEGYFLAPHAKSLPYADKVSANVTLQIPAVTKLRMLPPPRLRSSAHFFYQLPMKGRHPDDVAPWLSDGQWHLLVGESSPIRIGFGTSVRDVTVRRDDSTPVQVYEPELDEQLVVLRARLLDASDQPLRWARMRSDPPGALPAQMTNCNEHGCVHLLVPADSVPKVGITLTCVGGSDPRVFGAFATLHLGKLRGGRLQPGEARDLGDIRMTLPVSPAKKGVKK